MKHSKLFKIGMAVVAAVAVAAPASAQELTGTLKKIAEKGEINIGHRDASVPFSYLDDKQQPVGYSMDLCMKIVDAVKKKVGKDVKVKYQPVNPKTRIPLIQNGTIDLECGSTTNKLSRQEQVSFAPITYITGTKLLVKKASGVKELEDMNGKTIAVTQGTTNEKAIQVVAAQKGIKITLLPVKDHAEGFQALEAGRADAYSTDHILLFGLAAKAKNPADYDVVGRFLSYDPYAIMLPRNDSDFQVVVNRAIAQVFESGEINEIFKKHFDPLKVEMDELLKTSIKLNALPE